MTREELRGHCPECERGIVSGKGERWTAPNGSGHKDLKDYSVYCVENIGHGAVYPQFVANKANWTGLIPKWCPKIDKEAQI